MPASAVIFDCDGVLVDSERIGTGVLAALLTEAGLPTSHEEARALYTGRAMRDNLAIAEERLGRPLPFDLPARYYPAVEDAFRRELRPVPGVAAALAQLRLPDCVASSGPHRKMAVSLRACGLWDHFAGRIFSAWDPEVLRGKPAPDLFLHAAARMGFDPATTVVVEDSVPGVQGAVAAGMRALAYAADGDPAVLAAAGGEVFLDMAELPGLVQADRAGPAAG